MNKTLKLTSCCIVIPFIILLSANVLYGAEKKPAPKRIAVMDIQAYDAPGPAARVMRDVLEYYFFKSGYYEVLERGQIDSIMKERQKGAGSCSDKNCAAELGSMISADYVIIGTIERSGDYTVTIKVINVSRNSIVFTLSKNIKDLAGIKGFSETLAEEVHKKILAFDKDIRIPMNSSIIFSIGYDHLVPSGRFGEIMNNGYGASMEGGLTDILVRNLYLGTGMHVLYFKGREHLSHHGLLLPILAETGYEIRLWRFSTGMKLGGGGSYNSNSFYRFTSGSDYYTVSKWQPVSRIGLSIGFFIGDYLTINFQSYSWQVYEKNGTSRFYSVLGGLSIRL